jgi:hypothetical protein
MKKVMILFVICFTVFLTGCYYDREDELYGATTCDTSNVSFSGTISGLLNNYGCLGCHSGNTPSGSVNLQGYTNVKARVADGRLFGAVNHSAGFSPMPQGGNKMSPCDINKIKAWIDGGALNN